MNGIVGQPNLDFFENKISKVFEIGDLKISYMNDSLVLKINDAIINVNINFKNISIKPVRLGESYIIADDDSIYVYNGTTLINSHKRPAIVGCFARMETYNSWMNYYDGEQFSLSYSIKKNKFYSIRK